MTKPITLQTSDLEDNIAKFLRERLPQASISTVFDVGANIGWFTLMCLREFPEAKIWSFEPVDTTLQQMVANLSRFAESNPFPRTTCVQACLGSMNGTTQVTSYPGFTVNRIRTDAPEDIPLLSVDIYTGSDFCLKQNVSHIDYLKIDAEGHDLEVLKGFDEMLVQHNIDFVQVEAAMAPSQPGFISYPEFSDYLLARDYCLFRFTNQSSDDLPILMRADVVFISRAAAEIYRYK